MKVFAKAISISLFVFVAFGVAILLLLGLQAALLVASIALTYLLFDSLLSNDIFDSRAYKTVVAIFLYFVILQSVVLSLWFVSHEFPLHLAVSVTFAILVLSCLVRWRITRPQHLSRFKATSIPALTAGDSVALTVAILITLVTLIGPVRNARADNHGHIPAATILNFIDTSLDDASQLSMVNDRVQLDRGVLYKSDRAQYVALGSTLTYPTGWHSANVAVMQAADRGMRVGGPSVAGYVMSKIFWYFVLLYLFSRFVLIVSRPFFKKSAKYGNASRAALYTWLLGVVLFFAFYMLIEQFREGFYTFVPELIALLIAGALLVQRSVDRQSKTLNPYRSLTPLVVVTVGAFLAWILALPALLLSIAAAYLLTPQFKGFWQNTKSSLLAIWPFAPIITLGILSSLCQLVLTTSSSARSFKSGIDDPGGISIHNEWYFLFIAVGILLFYWFARRHKKRVEELSVLLFGLLAFATFIYLFQAATLGHIDYYTYKTLNVAIIIALPLAIAGWLGLLDEISTGLSPVTRLSFYGLALLGLPLCLGLNPTNGSTVAYLHSGRGFSNKEIIFMYQSLDDRARTNYKDRTQDVVIYRPGETGHSIVASNILRSIQPVDSCDSKVFDALATDNERGIITAVKTCTIPNAHLTIATTSKAAPTLKSLIETTKLQSRIAVKIVN